jgi:antitoxin Phd
MRIMTSLAAQNHFGEMIDTSQREPVLITRRGRPVSVVFSPLGKPLDVLLQLMELMRALAPIQGEVAAEAFDQYAKRAQALGSDVGLTEEEITALVHENR